MDLGRVGEGASPTIHGSRPRSPNPDRGPASRLPRRRGLAPTTTAITTRSRRSSTRPMTEQVAETAQHEVVVAGRRLWDDLRASVALAVVGAEDTIRLVAIALLADGHVLLEDVPGTGKTLLARAIARSPRPPTRRASRARRTCSRRTSPARACSSPAASGSSRGRCSRTCCSSTRSTARRRAPSRALLEAMQERQVTVEGDDPTAARPVPRARDAEPRRVRGHVRAAAGAARPVPASGRGSATPTGTASGGSRAATRRPPTRSTRSSPSSTSDRLLALRDLVRTVLVADEVEAYAVALVRATRGHPDIELGASPRATVALYRDRAGGGGRSRAGRS